MSEWARLSEKHCCFRCMTLALAHKIEEWALAERASKAEHDPHIPDTWPSYKLVRQILGSPNFVDIPEMPRFGDDLAQALRLESLLISPHGSILIKAWIARQASDDTQQEP